VIQHDTGHSSAVTTAVTYVGVFQQMAAMAARASAELLLSPGVKAKVIGTAVRGEAALWLVPRVRR
jgi:hypothetical protein